MNSRVIFQALLISALVFCTNAASADDREKFNNAYRDYQQHVGANEIEPALGHVQGPTRKDGGLPACRVNRI